MKIIAYWFRLLHFLRMRTSLYPILEITQTEIKAVRDRLIIICQRMYLSEYELLSKGLPLPSKSSLLSLNPFIDSDGFVRMNGRLIQAPQLAYNERYTKILPYEGIFTKLFV